MKYDIAGSYNVQKYPWYSPHLVLRAMSQLTRIYGSNVESRREFKLAREMFSAAVSLLGAFELHNDNKYYMQPNLQSSSPDVVAAKRTNIKSFKVLLEVTNLEIVDMNDFSATNDISEFLSKTKLSPRKSYDNRTLIVCVVNKKIKMNADEIAKGIVPLAPKSTIYILGKLQGYSYTWTLYSPYPQKLKPIIFSIPDTMKKYKLHDVTNFRKGQDESELLKNQKTTIFDIFNLNETEISRYKSEAVKSS